MTTCPSRTQPGGVEVGAPHGHRAAPHPPPLKAWSGENTSSWLLNTRTDASSCVGLCTQPVSEPSPPVASRLVKRSCESGLQLCRLLSGFPLFQRGNPSSPILTRTLSRKSHHLGVPIPAPSPQERRPKTLLLAPTGRVSEEWQIDHPASLRYLRVDLSAAITNSKLIPD